MKPSLYRVLALGLLASSLMPQDAWAAVAKPSLKKLKPAKAPRLAPPLAALRVRPDAPCYMETRYGWVDLSYMCQPPRVAQVKVVGTRQSGNRLVGQVKNETGKTVRYTIVNYLAPASNPAEMPQAAYTFVAPVILEPGQIGEFTITLNQPGPIQITTVDWEAVPDNVAGAY
jgi:hypothetical protein